MRVCVISFKVCWRDEGGAWRSDGGFPSQMHAIGSIFDAMTLMVVEGRPRAGGLLLPPAAQVVPLASPTGADLRRKLSVGARMPSYLVRMARQVRRADVVHTPLPGDLAFLGMLTALGLRRRLIARYGGSWAATSESTMMNRVTRQCMRLFAGGRNVMLATGVGAEPPAPGVHWVFSTAISSRELAEVQPDLTRGASEPLRVIFAGRLSPEKGLLYLLEAMALLRARGDLGDRIPQLTLAGDGPQREELVRTARALGVDDLIHFAGQLDRISLLTEMCRSDVCVLPSLTEGFCKALIDGMVCGLPAIATEAGSAGTVVGRAAERGWLVPYRDPAAIADALRRLVLQPPDWPALRRRCREFTEGLTIEAWAAEIARRCSLQWGVPVVDGKLGA
jgi:glycosyltransferase involved in cell wall biosynthesis